MGNSTLQAAFKQFRKEGVKSSNPPRLTTEVMVYDDSIILSKLESLIKTEMKYNSEVDQQTKLLINTNVETNQEPNEMDHFQAMKALSEIEARWSCGYKVAESNIEDLINPAHEKRFAVLTNQTQQEDHHKKQVSKAIILYGLYILKERNNDSKEKSFTEYASAFLKAPTDDDISETNSSAQIKSAVNMGFGFVLVVLKEMRQINNGSLLVKSLEYVLQSLKPNMIGIFHANSQHSFHLDASFNESREFLLELINDDKTDKQVITLAYKIIFMMGLTRSSVEDFLILCTLLQENKHPFVDLRDQLKIIKDQSSDKVGIDNKDEVFDLGDASHNGRDKTSLYLSSYGQHKIEISPTSDTWMCDGNFLYVLSQSKGLMKVTTGHQGEIAGRIVAQNSEFIQDSSSMMLYKNRLYIRHKEASPFTMVDKDTLLEIKLDSDLKFEPKEGQNQSLKWTEEVDDKGRSLEYSPLITDGSLIYVIARQGHAKDEVIEEEDKIQKFVIEIYDPSKNYEFVRQVTLYKTKNLDPFVKKKNTVDQMKECQWATNGSLIAMRLKKKIHFFSLESGVRVFKWKADDSQVNFDLEKGLITYDYVANQFYHIVEEDEQLNIQPFDFPNFKKTAAISNPTISLDKLEEQYLKDIEKNVSPMQKMNIIEQIMLGVSSNDLTQDSQNTVKPAISEKDLNVNLQSLTRSLILSFLSKKSQQFELMIDIKNANIGSVESADVMSCFRYPLVTYLTTKTMQQLGAGLKSCQNILDKEDNVETHELYSMLFLFKLISANFKALTYCHINISSLLTKDADYDSFMKVFKETVIKISAESDQEQTQRLSKASDEERKNIWQQISNQSKEIMAASMRLLHRGPAEIMKYLQDSFDKKEGDKCKVQIAYLSQESHLKTLSSELKSGENSLTGLLNIFINVASMHNDLLMKQLKTLTIDKIEENLKNKPEQDSQLILACQKFLTGFSQEILIRYQSATEKMLIKKASKVLSYDQESAKKELQRLEKAFCTVVDTTFDSLSEGFDYILPELKAYCDGKKENQWESVPENFKKYSKAISVVLKEQDTLNRVALMLVHSASISQNLDSTATRHICKGAVKSINSMSLLYTLWRKYGEKLGIEANPPDTDSSTLIDDSIQQIISKLRRELSWHIGQVAYTLIKIDPQEEKKEKNDNEEEDNIEKNAKKKEKLRKQALKMVLQSNLLSGGLEPGQLHNFSEDTKEQLIGQAKLMNDETLLNSLQQKAGAQTDEDKVLEAIIITGKDEDTDLMMNVLQAHLETKIPMVPFARLNGAQGFRLSRAAFAVMIKFNDLLDDFTMLTDCISMEAQMAEEGPSKIKELAKYLKSQPGADLILNRWEQSSRMRIWINEKKQSRSIKLEGKLNKDFRAKKKKAKEEAEKKEAEEKEKKEKEEAEAAQKLEEGGVTEGEKKDEKKQDEKPSEEKTQEEKSSLDEQKNQIDSSSKVEVKNDLKKEDVKKEDEKKEDVEVKDEIELTPEELKQIQNHAQEKLDKEMVTNYEKISSKAQFLIKLTIPPRFKRPGQKAGPILLLKTPSTMNDAPKPKLDWEGRLKVWKQLKTSQGAIRSLTDRKAEIWDSGNTSILALLQTAIYSESIQQQVEQTYLNSCRRAGGLKLIQDIISVDMPSHHFIDIVSWFNSSLRRNQNKLAHYLDDTTGQGVLLENVSKKHFFLILGSLIQRLKNSKDEKEIKIIINALKWKFIGRDHGDLSHLNIFSILHKGNNEKENLLKKAWGRNAEADCSSLDDQPVPKAVLELFEQLFLTVSGRIAEPDFGAALKLKSGGSGAPQLSKAKSIIDENVSETLLGQAFEVIFKELERYIRIMNGYKGINWSVYVLMRNQERKDEATPKVLTNEDNLLLDEIELEETEAENAEDKKEGDDMPAKDKEKEDKPATDEKTAPEAQLLSGEKSKDEANQVAESDIPKEAEIITEKKEDDENKEKEENGDKKSEKVDDQNGSDDEGENAEDKEKEDEEAAQKEQLGTKAQEREDRELKQLTQLYSETFLQRLLRLVEIFTSIATGSSHPLSMVQRVANPFHLSSLLNLLILTSPSNKLIILKIIQHISGISVPYEVFEEAIRLLTRDNGSIAYRIINEVKSNAKFDQSLFLKFLFNYQLSIRSKMWKSDDADSDCQYAVSQMVSATIRCVGSVHGKGDFWNKVLKEEITKGLLNVHNFQADESDILLSLLPGGEYGAVTAGRQALTNKDELVTVIGYSSNWKNSQQLLPSGDNMGDTYKKDLQKLNIQPEFTDPSQMAVALFFDKDNKQRQDMMLLHPSSLSLISGLDEEKILKDAQNSPLMDAAVAKHMISILQTDEKVVEKYDTSQKALLRQKQAQILKIISQQVEVVGECFINFLKDENLLKDLMTYLYNDIKAIGSKKSSGDNQVIPVKWLEAKIQNMRKLAVETNACISQDLDEVKVFLLNKKELVFKRTDHRTMSTLRTNAYLTSAINIHKVGLDTLYNCQHARDLIGLNDKTKQLLKNELVSIPFKELESLSETALAILNSSDAVVTTQNEDLDVKEFFKKLIEKYKEDQDAPIKTRYKYENILDTVIFFVSEEDFNRCGSPVDNSIKPKSVDPSKSQLERLLDELSEWGGLDKDQLLYNLKETDVDDMGKVMALIEEGLLEAQESEQKYLDELKSHQNSHDEGAIKNLKESQEKKQNKRKEIIEEKKKTLFKAKQKDDEKNGEKKGLEVPVFDQFTKDEEWWKELQLVAKNKISIKPANTDAAKDEENKKNDDQMTKLLYSTMSSFDSKQLSIEHSQAIAQLLTIQKKVCLFNIIKEGKQETVLPELQKTPEDQVIFSKFLKIQFNSCVIQMLQVGQKKSYQEIKQKMKNIFAFQKSLDENAFMKNFLLKEVVQAGVKSVIDFREQKTKKVIDYFQNEDNAVSGLNPYLLKFITSYLVKEDLPDLKDLKNCISTLINLHLAMVFTFQDSKVLIRKLLKSCLKLVSYANKHCKELIETGQMEQIIQIKLLKLATSEVNYEDQTDTESKKFSDQQLLFLELHLQIDQLHAFATMEHKAIISKITEDSESICKVKRDKQILQEKDNFNLLRYLYHLEHLEDHQKDLMNFNIETNHPAFDTMTRSFVTIPEVQRLKIKFKDSMKLKDLTYIGIGNSSTSDITLKSLKENEFDWPTNNFYLFYPVQKQCIVAFGANGSNCLGKSSGEGFKIPTISTPEESLESTFNPLKLYGKNDYTITVNEKGDLFESGSMDGCSNIALFTQCKLKEKVRLVSVASESCWLVLEDNSVWYKGTCTDNNHFPNNESKSTFTQFTIWKEKEMEQKIVNLASGQHYTLVVTDQGKLYGWGKRFLENVNQSSADPVDLKLPKDMLARRVWAPGSVIDSENAVTYIELEDQATKKKQIYSAGKSDKGMLGQGDKVKACSEFTKIYYESDETEYTQMSIGKDHIMAIDNKGRIWGWGSNENHKLSLADTGAITHKPFLLYTFNNLEMKALRISCGTNHSLIQFEDKRGKSILYSVGNKYDSNYCHLGVEETLTTEADKPFREIKTFSNRAIVDFHAQNHDSLVIMSGGKDASENLYCHNLPNGKQAKGLLHFYKKDGAWVFVPEDEFEQRKGELPDLCFAIKSPIEDIASKEWPDLDALTKEVFDSSINSSAEFVHEGFENTLSSGDVKGPMYHTRCIINHEEIEASFDQTSVVKGSESSLNPFIYFRVAKPMKKEVKLPSFNLENFYQQDSRHGIDIQIIPDLTYQMCHQLIKATQEPWDEIVDSDSKFDKKYKKDLLEGVNSKMATLLAEKPINDINFEKDVKFSEIEFKEKGLKKMNEKTKKQKANLYWMLNLYFFKLLAYNSQLLSKIPGSVYQLVQQTKSSLLGSTKNKYIDDQIRKLPQGSGCGMSIKRGAALRFKDTGKCDHTGEYTIFGQLFQTGKKNQSVKDAFRMNEADSQAFSVTFRGEGSIDAGGPFRETLSNVVTEIESDCLPLLIPCANNRNNHGFNRDSYVINSKSLTPTHQELFIFFGNFLGFAIRSKSAMDWHLAPIFWKQLLQEPVDIQDLKGIDAFTVQMIDEMKENASKYTAEQFDAIIEENFTTHISNDQVVELCPGGKDKFVNHANHLEYCDLLVMKRLSINEKQMEWVRQGVNHVIDGSILSFLTWEEVELRACGTKDITTEALKAISVYNVGEDNKHVKMFWEMFEAFDQDDRKRYLKFVWGRTKIPIDTSNLSNKHQFNVYTHMGDTALPESHTCFFTLDCPPYKTLELMTKKFKTAIEMCGEIDGDYGANSIADEDGDGGNDSY